MDYCPNCQHILDEDEMTCPTCGFKILQEPEEDFPVEDEDLEEELFVSPKKPFYKRPAFWVTTTIFLMIIIAACGITGSYIYFKEKKTNEYKAEVKSMWTEIVSKGKSLNNTAEAVNSQKDLAMLSNELSDMENLIADKQSKAINLEPPKKYSQQNKDFMKALNVLADYIIQAKIMANKDPLSVKLYKLNNLQTVSELAKTTTDNFVSGSDFINTDLPKGLFRINMVFRPLIEKAKADEKKRKTAEQEEKAANDTLLSQQIVISFMQARMHKDAAEMRRYLTEACARAFDPDIEFQNEFDSVDFQIIKTESTPEGFTITGDEKSRSWQGTKVTNRWEFKLIIDAGNWLIDHRNILSPVNQQTTKQQTPTQTTR